MQPPKRQPLHQLAIIRMEARRLSRPPLRFPFAAADGRIYRDAKARVAELVDAHDSKSCSARSGGSIPSTGTTLRSRSRAKADGAGRREHRLVSRSPAGR